MSYSTSLYDKINFLYSSKLQWPGGYQDGVQKFQKNFLTFLGIGTNVVKVSSMNSELLFQWDTLKWLYTLVVSLSLLYCLSVQRLGNLKTSIVYCGAPLYTQPYTPRL